MSKPKYRWWGFARRMIRDYPALKVVVDDLHRQQITASASAMPRGGGAGRTVETVALRKLPPGDQDVYDAVTKAIEITRLMPTGSERIAMIRYMYWGRQSHRLKDAAIRVHVSDRTAKQWHGDFVRLVGRCYGFSVEDCTPEPKERAIISS